MSTGCAVCGDPVPQARYGPPRRTCSPRCRTRAYRARLASQPVDLPTVEPVTVKWPAAPPDPVVWPTRSDVLPDAGPPLERLAAALQLLREVRTIMWTLATTRTVTPPLQVRAERTGEALDACLGEVWGIGERTSR